MMPGVMVNESEGTNKSISILCPPAAPSSLPEPQWLPVRHSGTAFPKTLVGVELPTARPTGFSGQLGLKVQVPQQHWCFKCPSFTLHT